MRLPERALQDLFLVSCVQYDMHGSVLADPAQ